MKPYAALFLLMFFASSHYAQGLSGTVVDADGAAIPNATVTIEGDAILVARTLSDGAGKFSLTPTGDVSKWQLRVTATGFENFEIPMSQVTWPIVVTLRPPPIESDVVVRITRGFSKISETPASVVVLEEDDLRSTAAQTTDDSLRQIAGLNLFRRSSSKTSNPTTQGANLRGVGGSGASRTAIEFEGVSLNDAFGGWTVWSRVPRIAIDEVEVLRGGASSLFGSSAISGAIAMSRKRTYTDGVRIDTSAGSQESLDASFLAALDRTSWHTSIAVEAFRTAGYIPTASEQRGLVDSPANSRHMSGLVEASRHLGNYGLIYARGNLFSERRDNGTALTNNRTYFRQGVVGGSLSPTCCGLFRLRTTIDGQVYDQTFSAVAADRNSESLTRVQRVPSRSISTGVTWSHSTASHAMTAAAETRYVRGFSEEVGVAGGVANSLSQAGGKESTFGVSGQDFWRVTKRLNISIGGRFDRWREFGGLSRTRSLVTNLATETIFPERTEESFSPRLAAVYALTDSISVFGSYARSFRAPSLNELYRSFRVGNVITQANENLRAETADTFEAGINTRISKRMTLRANVFHTNVDDPIVNVTLTSTPTLITRRRENVGATRSRGLETDAEFLISENLRLNFGYLFVDSRVVDAGTNLSIVGKRLPQVARQQFTSQFTYRPQRAITVSFQARASDAQFEDDLNLFRLRPYFVLDTYAAYRFRKRVELFAAVENVFDSRYDIGLTPVRTVAAPRYIRAGLRFNLNRKN